MAGLSISNTVYLVLLTLFVAFPCLQFWRRYLVWKFGWTWLKESKIGKIGKKAEG